MYVIFLNYIQTDKYFLETFRENIRFFELKYRRFAKKYDKAACLVFRC